MRMTRAKDPITSECRLELKLTKEAAFKGSKSKRLAMLQSIG